MKKYRGRYKEYQKKYRKLHKKERAAKAKKYYFANINRIKNYNQSYYKSHKKEILLRHKSNPEALKKAQQKYKKYRKIERRIYKRNYTKNRRNLDINFKILSYLRTRLCLALKNNLKTKTTIKLVGCSIKFLKQYLESRFKSGMSWNNYGRWHIDHIKSCASFDLTKALEQKKCFHYTNLQPLWAEDNIKKGSK
jgi:hypothetical protein